MNREVWEGWTPQDFVDDLYTEIHMIMNGQSWRKPFTTKDEMVEYIREHQPHYKKSIPEVNDYFANLYWLN
ncbi:MAG: hypothetical protein RSB62_11000 [Bacteroides sp.]